MKKSTRMHWAPASVAFAASLLAGGAALAQNAPGEDPVILSKRVAVQMIPIGGARGSTPMDNVSDMPAWLKAKVARFEAKANSDQTGDLITENDIARSASSDGVKKTCIQEVGSNSAATSAQNGMRYGPGNAQQIVVLRGDLVNICK